MSPETAAVALVLRCAVLSGKPPSDAIIDGAIVAGEVVHVAWHTPTGPRHCIEFPARWLDLPEQAWLEELQVELDAHAARREAHRARLTKAEERRVERAKRAEAHRAQSEAKRVARAQTPGRTP